MTRWAMILTVALVLLSLWAFYAAYVLVYGLVMFGWCHHTRDYVSRRLRAFWTPLRLIGMHRGGCSG